MDTDAAMESASLIFVNTNLCAAVACCTTLIFTWVRYKKPDVSMTYNAALAGLVGITAGCDMVSPLGAAIMGIIFGVVIVLAIEFFDRVAKIDDPVGAISVHGVCGSLGTILTGLFATDGGVFYGGGFKFFGIQVLGVVTVAVFVAVMITIVFKVIQHTIGLRCSAEEEIAGLDISEHGLVSAYADFMPSVEAGTGIVSALDENRQVTGNVAPDVAVPVQLSSTPVPQMTSDTGMRFTKLILS